MIPAAVAIYGAVTLRELFGRYEEAIIFAPENVRCYRRLGYTLILWVFANMAFIALISMVLTLGNPPGERHLVMQFGTSDLATLIIGAIVALVSWVMNEASKMRDEQAYTV